MRAQTEHGTFTDWTKGFSLNAVGTSGNYSAKLGEQQYKASLARLLMQYSSERMNDY